MAQSIAELRSERDRMVDHQIAGRGISDPRVLEAMRRVPRERFVTRELKEFAYEDTPLPIEEGQTISQPYIVALMVEAAEVKPGDRVLDVGTGSGYAAAVLSQIAREVYTIERHAALAATAERRFEELGYNNINVRHGDGTLGWPEAAPFDAIIVAAGGPEIPETLRNQLKIGGRLIIPIGAMERAQRLIRVVRDGEHDFHEEDLGPVAFVPLVGEHGWSEGSDDRTGWRRAEQRAPATRRRGPADLIRQDAERLPDIEAPAFGPLFDRFAEARIVLLGEATHGTSEFYRARAAITRHLIERHGFTIVAVEADWPDAAAIDRYVRHMAVVTATEPAFQRFPTWMWRNLEVHDFIEWLRAHNETLPRERRAGFFGLDLYSLNASIRAVIDYLERVDPAAARIARERYGCLTPWQRDPASYGRAALNAGYAKCEEPVVAMLHELMAKRFDNMEDDEGFFDAEQNARLVVAAERYYRVMYYGAAESWNLRDEHMFGTLARLLAWRGDAAKAVVWAHNSHIGNAAATEMGLVRGEINIGQLCREQFGVQAVMIGFGTDRGTVAAASEWDGPMEIKQVRPAHPDSYERLCRDSGVPKFMLDLRAGAASKELRAGLLYPRLERAIGVIYRPETELASHYFDASLPRQFDAYVWFEETRAVTPLPAEVREHVPDTYPFGL
jgi:protein-L-isoaspartate(D-aspartate) O-methyltransferase